VTEETNAPSANWPSRSRARPAVLLKLARQTRDLLRTIPATRTCDRTGRAAAALVIEPDRELCARYKANIDDVNALVNTALGGDPSPLFTKAIASSTSRSSSIATC